MNKPCVNEDGTANKNHVKKMWNVALNTMIDDYNNDLSDDDFNARVDEFKEMANQLALQSKPTTNQITNMSKEDKLKTNNVGK